MKQFIKWLMNSSALSIFSLFVPILGMETEINSPQRMIQKKIESSVTQQRLNLYRGMITGGFIDTSKLGERYVEPLECFSRLLPNGEFLEEKPQYQKACNYLQNAIIQGDDRTVKVLACCMIALLILEEKISADISLHEKFFLDNSLSNEKTSTSENNQSTGHIEIKSSNSATFEKYLAYAAHLSEKEEKLEAIHDYCQAGRALGKSVIGSLRSECTRDGGVLWSIRYEFEDLLAYFLTHLKPGKINEYLFNAVSSNNINTVKLFIARGADINFTCDGRTVLHYANSGEMVDALFALGAKFLKDCADGFNAWHEALYDGNLPVIIALMRNSQEIKNEEKDFCKEALASAFSYGHEHIVQFLFKKDKSLFKHRFVGTNASVLHQAAHIGSCILVQKIIDNFCENGMLDIDERDANGATALHYAVKGSGIKFRDSTTEDSNRYLNAICGLSLPVKVLHSPGRNFIEVIRLLVAHGASLHGLKANGDSLLTMAAENGNKGIVEYLMENGVGKEERFNQNFRTPFYRALVNGHKEITDILLDRNVLYKKNIFEDVPGFPEGYKLMHILAQRGCSAGIPILISYGASVNSKGKNGFTPLHEASEKGHSDVVATLMLRGADKTAQLSDGSTSLQLAAEMNHEKVVDLLLSENKNSIESLLGKEEGCWSSVHAATRAGLKQVIRVLIKSKKNQINDGDEKGKTPLFIATEEGNFETVQFLVSLGANVNSPVVTKSCNSEYEGWMPLDCACSKNNREMVKFFLERGALVNYNNLLLTSLNAGHFEIAEMLLTRGAKFYQPLCELLKQEEKQPLNENGAKSIEFVLSHIPDLNAPLKYDDSPYGPMNTGTLLHGAVQQKNNKLVRLLINKGVDPNKANDKGNSPLHDAASQASTTITKMLIEAGATINALGENDQTPLHRAVNAHQEEQVNLLLAYGADVTVLDLYKRTPLDWAVPHFYERNGNPKIALMLLRKTNLDNLQSELLTRLLDWAAREGLEEILKILLPTCKTSSLLQQGKITLLMLAAESGHEKAVCLLLENGASVDTADHNGHTALHKASAGGFASIVTLLIENGSEVNVKGTCALHRAAEFGHADVIEILIKNKANVNAKTEKNLTALHCAVNGYNIGAGNLKTVELLLNAGADVEAKTPSGKTLIDIAREKYLYDIMRAAIQRGAKYTWKDAFYLSSADVLEKLCCCILLPDKKRAFKRSKQ